MTLSAKSSLILPYNKNKATFPREGHHHLLCHHTTSSVSHIIILLLIPHD